MGARGHLNGAARRRRRLGLCKLAGGTGYVGSITTRGAPLGREAQLPVTPNCCISQPRPTMARTPAGVHDLSCAVTRRSPPPKPPATSGYLLANLRVDAARISEVPSQPAGSAAGGRSRRAENDHRRRVPEPRHPGGGTKKHLSTVSRFDREFRIIRWWERVPSVGPPLPPAEDDKKDT